MPGLSEAPPLWGSAQLIRFIAFLIRFMVLLFIVSRQAGIEVGAACAIARERAVFFIVRAKLNVTLPEGYMNMLFGPELQDKRIAQMIRIIGRKIKIEV